MHWLSRFCIQLFRVQVRFGYKIKLVYIRKTNWLCLNSSHNGKLWDLVFSTCLHYTVWKAPPKVSYLGRKIKVRHFWRFSNTMKHRHVGKIHASSFFSYLWHTMKGKRGRKVKLVSFWNPWGPQTIETPTRRKVRENAICCRAGVNVPKELPREALVRLIQ